MKEITESPLQYWSDSKAAEKFIGHFNELVRAHNNLTAEVEEVNKMIDMINDVVFSVGEVPPELDS